MKLHPFEDQQLTAFEIHALVPVMSIDTVRRKLRSGITTRAGMMEDPTIAMRQGGKRSKKRNAGRFRI